MSTAKSRRRKAVKLANFSANGWPKPEFRLPDPEVLEALSRPNGDGTQEAADTQGEMDLSGVPGVGGSTSREGE